MPSAAENINSSGFRASCLESFDFEPSSWRHGFPDHLFEPPGRDPNKGPGALGKGPAARKDPSKDYFALKGALHGVPCIVMDFSRFLKNKALFFFRVCTRHVL